MNIIDVEGVCSETMPESMGFPVIGGLTGFGQVDHKRMGMA
jgi:hypothetical protein